MKFEVTRTYGYDLEKYKKALDIFNAEYFDGEANTFYATIKVKDLDGLSLLQSLIECPLILMDDDQACMYSRSNTSNLHLLIKDGWIE